jgi:hypothetical protein
MSKTKLKSILAYNRATRCETKWNKQGKKSYTNAWLFGGEQWFWRVHLT